MKEFEGEKFYNIYDLHKIVKINNIELFCNCLNPHVFIDGMVSVVHSNLENLENFENILNNCIINDILAPTMICSPKPNQVFRQAFNFKGFFNFVLSDKRALCLFPTNHSLVDGKIPDENKDFYFVIDLNDILMSLDRKLIQETAYEYSDLYLYEIRFNFLNSKVGHLLSLYFSETDILNYAKKKGIDVNLPIAELKTKEDYQESSNNISKELLNKTIEIIEGKNTFKKNFDMIVDKIENPNNLKQESLQNLNPEMPSKNYLEILLNKLKTQSRPNLKLLYTIIYDYRENNSCNNYIPDFEELYSYLLTEKPEIVLINKVSDNVIKLASGRNIQKENLKRSYARQIKMIK